MILIILIVAGVVLIKRRKEQQEKLRSEVFNNSAVLSKAADAGNGGNTNDNNNNNNIGETNQKAQNNDENVEGNRADVLTGISNNYNNEPQAAPIAAAAPVLPAAMEITGRTSIAFLEDEDMKLSELDAPMGDTPMGPEPIAVGRNNVLQMTNVHSNSTVGSSHYQQNSFHNNSEMMSGSMPMHANGLNGSPMLVYGGNGPNMSQIGSGSFAGSLSTGIGIGNIGVVSSFPTHQGNLEDTESSSENDDSNDDDEEHVAISVATGNAKAKAKASENENGNENENVNENANENANDNEDENDSDDDILTEMVTPQ